MNTSSKQQTMTTRAWRPSVTDFTVDWCDVGSPQSAVLRGRASVGAVNVSEGQMDSTQCLF